MSQKNDEQNPDELIDRDAIKELVAGKKPAGGDDNPTQEEEVEVSPQEAKAREQGWRPEEEYDGDPEKWVDAGEFLRRASLFEKIHNQNREMKKLKEQVSALSEHYNKVYDSSYKKALEDLKAQRAEAIDDGDTKTVFAIEDQIKVVEKEQRSQEADVTPEFEVWVQDNKWYHDDAGMRTRADELGLQFAQKNPDIAQSDPDQVYSYVRKRMEIEYPDQFDKPVRRTARRSAADVEDGTSQGRKFKKRRTLTATEKQIMDTLVRGGHVTEEQYYADLDAVDAGEA